MCVKKRENVLKARESRHRKHADETRQRELELAYETRREEDRQRRGQMAWTNEELENLPPRRMQYMADFLAQQPHPPPLPPGAAAAAHEDDASLGADEWGGMSSLGGGDVGGMGGMGGRGLRRARREQMKVEGRYGLRERRMREPSDHDAFSDIFIARVGCRHYTKTL